MLDGLVITHDSIAEGVHFLPFDPPASVGWKLVAVNLSDLAAKGATPAGALLSLTLSGDGDWEMRFLAGIEAACESYGLPLIGGDTIALPPGAPRVLGLTAIGARGPSVPHRAGGKPGDALWLVGTLGDSAAGLAQLRDDPEAAGPLVDVYRRPVPQLGAGQRARAACPRDDGRVRRAAARCAADGRGEPVRRRDRPRRAAAVGRIRRSCAGGSREARLFAATGGDDYALLGAFAARFDPSTLSLPKGTTITARRDARSGRSGHLG